MVTIDTESIRNVEHLSNKIISDHLRYACAINTLKMWEERSITTETSKVTNVNIELRKHISNYIASKKGEKAYFMLIEARILKKDNADEHKILDMLGKQIFIDYVVDNNHVDAVEFAKNNLEHKAKADVDKILTLVGYKGVSNSNVSEFCEGPERSALIQQINDILFMKEVGREKSLLSLSLNHYASILKFDKY